MHDMHIQPPMTTERAVIEDCACQKVRMAARAVTRAYDDALRRAGLRATQFAVLVAVEKEGAISITALAAALGMDRTTLTRNLAPLVKMGLIAVGVEGWRRSRALQITREGRTRLRAALPLWERAQEALKDKLGDRDWIRVHESLDRLIQAA
jgi:DNA-binding MarR family transcriptional regulator